MFLDVDFFASLKTFAIRPPSSSSPYNFLVAILRQAPSIIALRIRVAESTGERSPWIRSVLQRPDGIPVANILSPLLSMKKFKLLQLKTLELDALSDIAPLLRITPNLEQLHLNLPNGFAAYTNSQFVEALQYVPKLMSLSYSAESLRSTGFDEDEESDEIRVNGEVEDNERNGELVAKIGEVLPHLEVLDLQSRWYGDEVAFPLAVESVESEVSSLQSIFNCELVADFSTTEPRTSHDQPPEPQTPLTPNHCSERERLFPAEDHQPPIETSGPLRSCQVRTGRRLQTREVDNQPSQYLFRTTHQRRRPGRFCCPLSNSWEEGYAVARYYPECDGRPNGRPPPRRSSS